MIIYDVFKDALSVLFFSLCKVFLDQMIKVETMTQARGTVFAWLKCSADFMGT